MSASILVINCGSSSIKFSLTRPASSRHRLSGQIANLNAADTRLTWTGDFTGEKQLPPLDHRHALQELVQLLKSLELHCDAIGHRVVHGGEHFQSACRVDEASLQALQQNMHLAPLHNPLNLLGIEAAKAAFPDLPQVMVFDTAFHQSMPEHAFLYAIPYALYQEHGIRRYGFHGTSHRYVAEQAAALLNKPLTSLRLVTAHLGNGCSAAAIQGGRSVDTTMGLTPLEGLVMGTRSGDVDPSLHAFLCERLDLPLSEVMKLLNHQSGLLGLSGTTHDMREIYRGMQEGDPRARIAFEVFCYRLAKAIAGLVVGLGQLDAVIFTGGIGENSPAVRERTLEQLAFLGVTPDPDRNRIHGAGHQGIITLESHPCAMVIHTDEERVIARDTATLLNLS
jgi:acetate kinase